VFESYLRILANISSRYFLVAGLVFFIFYVLLYRKIAASKLQKALPKQADYLREIGYSILTISLFALIPLLLVFNEQVRPYTSLYREISEMGWIYYFLAFPVMAVMHDTYFYWTHRMMHHPKLYRVMHSVHHASVNPSPWAAYAFHPTEAVIEIGIFVVFIFTLPVHRSHIFLFFLFSIVYNVYGHLGWELYSDKFVNSKIGRWINTSRQHNLHHRYFTGNYGLYFLFWDRWMGTLRSEK
jgi:lathosterol oxidase